MPKRFVRFTIYQAVCPDGIRPHYLLHGHNDVAWCAQGVHEAFPETMGAHTITFRVTRKRTRKSRAIELYKPKSYSKDAAPDFYLAFPDTKLQLMSWGEHVLATRIAGLFEDNTIPYNSDGFCTVYTTIRITKDA